MFFVFNLYKLFQNKLTNGNITIPNYLFLKVLRQIRICYFQKKPKPSKKVWFQTGQKENTNYLEEPNVCFKTFYANKHLSSILKSRP